MTPTEPSSVPELPPGDPFDALRAVAAAEFDPELFLRNNKSMATLSVMMLTGWRCYYEARNAAVLVAKSSLSAQQADVVVAALVTAMKAFAQAPFTATELLTGLEEAVLPYVRDLVERSKTDEQS